MKSNQQSVYRVNRISNLADDLALALAAKDVQLNQSLVKSGEYSCDRFIHVNSGNSLRPKPENPLEIPQGKAVNGTARTFDLSLQVRRDQSQLVLS